MGKIMTLAPVRVLQKKDSGACQKEAWDSFYNFNTNLAELASPVKNTGVGRAAIRV